MSAFLRGLFFAVAFSAGAQAEVGPQFYVHGGANLGFGVLQASDIDKTLENDFSHANIAFPPALLVRGGIRNILQVEGRRVLASHDLVKSGFIRGDIGIVGDVKMDYRSTDVLVKINPFFARSQSRTKGYGGWFLVGGLGKVEYRDEATDNGFEGGGPIWGVEYFAIMKNASVTFGATLHTITFDKGTLVSTGVGTSTGDPLPGDLKGNYYMFYMSGAYGLGR